VICCAEENALCFREKYLVCFDDKYLVLSCFLKQQYQHCDYFCLTHVKIAVNVETVVDSGEIIYWIFTALSVIQFWML